MAQFSTFTIIEIEIWWRIILWIQRGEKEFNSKGWKRVEFKGVKKSLIERDEKEFNWKGWKRGEFKRVKMDLIWRGGKRGNLKEWKTGEFEGVQKRRVQNPGYVSVFFTIKQYD